MIKCPECKSGQVTKAGYNWRNRRRIQRWRCEDCGRIFNEPENSDNPEPKNSHSKESESE